MHSLNAYLTLLVSLFSLYRIFICRAVENTRGHKQNMHKIRHINHMQCEVIVCAHVYLDLMSFSLSLSLLLLFEMAYLQFQF